MIRNLPQKFQNYKLNKKITYTSNKTNNNIISFV